MHSTNYVNTLILPAPDCLARAKLPEKPGSVAYLQYEVLVESPYVLTSDDVLCGVAAARQGISREAFGAFRAAFFSKGQPCFRASPLTKTHGWAVHSDEEARVALIDPESAVFATLSSDPLIKSVPAMRNKRA